MSAFDVALERKIDAVYAMRSLTDVLDTLEAVPPEERSILNLPLTIANLPLAIVTSDIVEIAETFPGDDVYEETSPLLDHFISLERPIVIHGAEHALAWSFGAEWSPSTRAVFILPFTSSGEAVRTIPRESMRIFQGILRLSNEFLEHERVSRPERRRAARAFPMAAAVSEVSTLRLRRVEQGRPSGESRPVEWSHRWLVRGHWRRLRNRTVWVRRHVKGPGDRPLVLKEKRVRFDR